MGECDMTPVDPFHTWQSIAVLWFNTLSSRLCNYNPALVKKTTECNYACMHLHQASLGEAFRVQEDFVRKLSLGRKLFRLPTYTMYISKT